MQQRYLVDVTAEQFNEVTLRRLLEKAIREHVSDWLGYEMDVAVKVTLDQT